MDQTSAIYRPANEMSLFTIEQKGATTAVPIKWPVQWLWKLQLTGKLSSKLIDAETIHVNGSFYNFT